MRPDHLYFSYRKHGYIFGCMLRISMRITHNQNMICIFVVFEAQLLAMHVAKNINSSSLFFFDNKSKISTEIDVRDAKSSISRERDFAFVEHLAK